MAPGPYPEATNALFPARITPVARGFPLARNRRATCHAPKAADQPNVNEYALSSEDSLIVTVPDCTELPLTTV